MSNATFDSFKIPLEQFRMSKDGREWKHMAGQRRALYIELASFTDADGTNAYPKISTLIERLGWSHGKLCYILDDLKELGRVERTGRKGQRGPAIRKLVPPVAESSPQSCESPKVVSESPKLNSQSPKVDPESPTAIGRLTCPTDPPNKPALLPARELAGRLAHIFGQKVGFTLPVGKKGREIITAAIELAGSVEVVERLWKRWLDQRNLDGLRFPLGKFLEELPGLVGADSSSEREYTKEEIDAIRAQVDQQLAQEKADLDRRLAAEKQAEEYALANVEKWL